MRTCEFCGHGCDEGAVTVSIGDGPGHVFDCLRCAETQLASPCRICGRRLVRRLLRVDGETYCSAGCAEQGRARNAWLPGRGEGNVDAVGTTPPRIGAPPPPALTAVPRPRDGRGRLRARAGDRIVVRSRRVDAPPRDAEILQVPSADGGPPFLVRWSDTEHVALYFPGPDALISARSAAELAL